MDRQHLVVFCMFGITLTIILSILALVLLV